MVTFSKALRWLSLILIYWILIGVGGIQCAVAGQLVRVGVYENPPLVYKDSNGHYTGISVELMRQMAKEEGWLLQFIPGTWQECLQRLDDRNIDVLAAVAFSEERARKYIFNRETVINNWGQVYLPKNSSLDTIFDLQDKRVAILAKDIYYSVFQEMMAKFQISWIPVETGDYYEVFRKIASGEVDAGVVNRLFGQQYENRYALKRSSIIFFPLDVHFAYPQTISQSLVQTMDRYLGNWKQSSDSVYYQILERWFASEIPFLARAWVKWVLGGTALLAFILGAGAFLLQAKVKARTRELSERNQDLEKEVRQRQETAAALQRSERLYRLLVENIDMGITLIDRHYRILMTNSAQARLFQKEHKTIAGQFCYHEFEKRADVCDHCPGRLAMSEKRSFSCETEGVRDDGTHFIVRIRAFPAIDEDGNADGFIEVVEDITRSKEAERDIQAALTSAEDALDKIDAILHSVSDGLLVVDLDGKVILANPASRRLLQASSAALPIKLEDFVGAVDLLQPLNNALQQRVDGWTFDLRLSGIEQAPQPVLRCKTSLLMDKGGEQRGAIFLVQNVTHEREVERLKSEFVSTAAHELRTPLTTVLGFSELLLNEEGFSREQQREFLNYIYEKADGLSRLVDDLLDVARIEEGRGLILHPESCNLADFLESLVQPLQHDAPQHQISLHLPASGVVLEADRGKLKQVFENLLSNAIKYSPNGGPITITVTRNDSFWDVAIADKGVGMAADDVDKIFDKFYRADSSNTAVRGVGLGLGIVKYIVEAHGGTIRVESTLGQGTTVHFNLPLSQRDLESSMKD